MHQYHSHVTNLNLGLHSPNRNLRRRCNPTQGVHQVQIVSTGLCWWVRHYHFQNATFGQWRRDGLSKSFTNDESFKILIIQWYFLAAAKSFEKIHQCRKIWRVWQEEFFIPNFMNCKVAPLTCAFNRNPSLQMSKEVKKTEILGIDCGLYCTVASL